MSYTDKELDAIRATSQSDRFYAEKAGTAVPGIARLVERLDASERELAEATLLLQYLKTNQRYREFAFPELDEWFAAHEQQS